MNPLRVMIVDDEAPARARLRTLLDDIAAEVPTACVGEAADGVEALRLLSAAPVDVLLVDIRMPRMDGVELARHLARLDEAPAVVFTTAYDEYAVRAFEVNAIDYLLKPVRAAPLPAEALAQLAPQGRRHFSVSERGRIRLVPIDEVLYLKAELKYVTARTREAEYLLDESLTHLEDEFGPRFVRVHRNCLVARGAIVGFEKTADADGETHWAVRIAGAEERLPVSRRQWPGVKAAFAGEERGR